MQKKGSPLVQVIVFPILGMIEPNNTWKETTVKEHSQIRVPFANISGKRVEADFAGGTVTSDGGALLLRAVVSQMGVVTRMASSTESVGNRRVRQIAKCMIQSDFHRSIGPKAVCFSYGQFRFVVEPFDSSGGDRPLRVEPVEQQRAM